MKLKILIHRVNIIKNILHYSWNNTHSIWVMKLPLIRKKYNKMKHTESNITVSKGKTVNRQISFKIMLTGMMHLFYL